MTEKTSRLSLDKAESFLKELQALDGLEFDMNGLYFHLDDIAQQLVDCLKLLESSSKFVPANLHRRIDAMLAGKPDDDRWE